MRAFLRELLVRNHQIQHSWHVARLEYARWHSCLNCAHVGLEEVAWLWEREGQLVAFAMPDGGPGEAHFCVDPDLRTPELEEEMLTVAEEQLAAPQPTGARRLCVWAQADDAHRQELLVRRGYAKEGWAESQWRRRLDSPLRPAPLAPGYTLRALGDGLELLERCYASGLGFHAGNIQVAVDNRTDVTWYRNIQMAPLYRRDLDLVAVAPDGSIAAFCTIWFDDVTRSAYFEPVATVPAHQRHGLAKALMSEGLQRLQRMGALTAFVSGYGVGANALYPSVMGDDHASSEPWVKEW
jgi:ribosomal protein S18 acetylase RimI-like enzyme